MTISERPLSTGTLCYLFADRLDGFVPNPKGDEAPLTGIRFDPRSYVGVAWAITIQRLAECGAIKLLRGPRVVRRPQAPQGRMTGFDAAVLDGAAVPIDVYRLILAWLGRTGSYAKSEALARDDAIAVGLGSLAREGGPIRRKRKDLSWDEEAVLDRAVEFGEVHSGWLRFRSEEPDLATSLVIEVQRAHDDCHNEYAKFAFG